MVNSCLKIRNHDDRDFFSENDFHLNVENLSRVWDVWDELNPQTKKGAIRTAWRMSVVKLTFS